MIKEALGTSAGALGVQPFALAPMSRVIRTLTTVLFFLPVAFFAAAALGKLFFAAPGLFLAAIYAWVWLRFRPSRFVVHLDALEIVWPLKRRWIPRRDIASVRRIGMDELRRETGWALRVGAGGLWGGFGWLWTKRRGVVQMYVSREDGLVWIERHEGRPWLITPVAPADFVRALTDTQTTAGRDLPPPPR